MTTTQPTIQISTTLFWSIYNTLLSTEKALENFTIDEVHHDQIEAHKDVCHALGRMETIVSTLKDIDYNGN
jgi:hypothetical protein